ncbi:MAG: tetratricopeptide repeat protein [Rhizomicrobium sp.]|jgi:tetratricopeptide (TPR) repeat protein
MRLAAIGVLAWAMSIGPAMAADAPDPLSGCTDLKNIPPGARIDTCKSLLAAGTLTQDQTHTALHGLGVAYAQQGDFTFAIDTFTTALASYPDDSQEYLSRGAAYLASGRNDLGLADYDKAVALQPKHSYLMRATAYYVLHKYALAVADCDAELRLVPDDADAKKLRDKAQAHVN